MNERTMTAMFDTRGAAESARDALVELGVGVDDIAIHGTESGTDATIRKRIAASGPLGRSVYRR